MRIVIVGAGVAGLTAARTLHRAGYAKRRGWEVVREVSEVGSGAVKRPQREELIKSAKRREVDAVLVWRLDRWGRSVADLVNSLAELEAVGVAFVSVTEALDLTTPAGPGDGSNGRRLRAI